MYGKKKIAVGGNYNKNRDSEEVRRLVGDYPGRRDRLASGD